MDGLEKTLLDRIASLEAFTEKAREEIDTLIWNARNQAIQDRHELEGKRRRAALLEDFNKRLDLMESTGQASQPLAAAVYRIEKLERKFVDLFSDTARYMRRREAADNELKAQMQSLRYDLKELRDRLSNVELAAFPGVSDTVAKIIGSEPGNSDNPLDRKPRGHR